MDDGNPVPRKLPLPDFNDPHFFQTVAVTLRMSFDLTSAYLMSLTALARGMEVTFFRTQEAAGTSIPTFLKEFRLPTFYRIGHRGRYVHFFGSAPEESMSERGAYASRNKATAKLNMLRSGVTTPLGGAVTSADMSLIDVLERKGVRKFVVKPSDGSLSRGVMADLNAQEAKRHIAREPDRTWVVEQYIQGLEYRVLVVNGEIFAAYMRRRRHVIGNGVDTVRDLIAEKLERQKRNPRSAAKLIPIEEVEAEARDAGVDLTSVPEAGAVVELRSTTVFQTGDAYVCPPEFYDQVRDLARRASLAFEAAFVALDFIRTPSGRDYLLELNAKPSYDNYNFPLDGEWNLDVQQAILDSHFPEAEFEARQVATYDFVEFCKHYANNPDHAAFDLTRYATFK